ncbi:MAG TPA: ABC transporter permease [Acetobacteraceae bacterium]|jgi:peptide/nickel transport system permease protein|nr:ABC transporter permease [Acetobacteraceae bacterium]
MTAPRALRSGRVLAGAALILFVASCALFAPLLARHDPGDQDLLSILLPPAWQHGGDTAFPLGTDSLGRDELARLLFGGRLALVVAITAACGAALLGAVLAHIAGYFGGSIDWLIGRAVEVWMSFPPVILSLILMVGLGTGADKVVLAIILVDWTRFCRVMRAEVLVTARRDYIAAARLSGFTHWQTLTREIVPATLPLLITLLSLEMGIAVIVEAVLSFVGLGVSADQTAWGQMIADARSNFAQAPWTLLLPMAAIFLTVTGFNLSGDGLRRTLDVRLGSARSA